MKSLHFSSNSEFYSVYIPSLGGALMTPRPLVMISCKELHDLCNCVAVTHLLIYHAVT